MSLYILRRGGENGFIGIYIYSKNLVSKFHILSAYIQNKNTTPIPNAPFPPILSIIPIHWPLLLSIPLMRIQSLRLWNRIIFRPAAVPRRARQWRTTRRVSRRREVGHEDRLGAIRGRGWDRFRPPRVSAAAAAAGEEPVDLVWAPPGDDYGDDYGDDGDDDAG